MTFLRTLLLACAFSLASSMSALAQGSRVEFNDDPALQMESYCPLPGAANPGWIPIRLRVKNLSDEVLKRSLEFDSSRSRNTTIDSVSELQLAPQEERELNFLVPYFELGHSDSVRLLLRDGLELLQSDSIFSVASASVNQSSIPALLVQEGDRLPRNATPIQLGTRQVLFSSITKDNLPTDWRALSTLSLVVLDVDSVLPAAAQMDAIGRWVALGGSLVVHGRRSVAESALATAGLTPQARMLITRDEGRADIYRHGLGRLALNPADGAILSLRKLIPETGWNHAIDAADADGPPGGCFPPAFSATQLGLPGAGAPPIKILTGLLIIVALAMGPIQFHVLKKRKSPPHRFLQITPILGLFFLVAVLTVSLASQGISVRSSVQSVTWIDQQAKQASTLARSTSFSGSLFAQRLRFDESTLLVPSSQGLSSRSKRRFRVDLDNGNQLSGDFMPTRAPASTASASSQTFRGGLRLERTADALFVVNELDRELVGLRLRDGNGTHYRLAESNRLPVGARMQLTADDGIAELTIPSPVQPPPLQIEAGLKPVTDTGSGLNLQHFPRILPLRSWKGVVEESPFVPTGGVKRKAEHQAHLWIGVLEDVR